MVVFASLQPVQPHPSGPINWAAAPDDDCRSDFNDLDDEETVDELDGAVEHETAVWGNVQAVAVAPENIALSLPSTYSGQESPLTVLELRLRIQQAERYLQDLREAIAEKSFLYSHVIRIAPRKAVRTHSQTTIASLNLSMASSLP